MSTSNVVKSVAEDRYLLCTVYSPARMPKRGADGYIDVATPRTLEKAAWKFAEHGFKTGVGHKPGGSEAARVVESWIHRGPTWKVMGPDGTVTKIRKGTWLVGLILSPEAWADYKAGRFTGVSVQGNTRRRPASPEVLGHLKELT